MTEQTYEIVIYTRKPEMSGYTASLANSAHFAINRGGSGFEPLNQNYGILFARADISEQNTIIEKGIKNPYIFKTSDGAFGIIAVRVDKMGNNDSDSKGKVLLWTSVDLIQFHECGFIKLHDDISVETAVCEYIETVNQYRIYWRSIGGEYFINILNSRFETEETSFSQSMLNNMTPCNIISINNDLAKKVCDYWNPVYNTEIIAPESIKTTSEEDIRTFKAKAIYSDGSEALKDVNWNLSSVDFTKPGKYTIQGTVVQDFYNFPLAIGYADPVICKWNGKYYFLATNDNKGNIGFYAREADSVQDLFKPGVQEVLILDYDEERKLIQTFWAPEFHIIGSDLYILFAVSGNTWNPQCHMMKLKKGGHIINPLDWENPVRVKKADDSFLAEDGISLDMTYFNAEGGHYLVWSYRKGIGTPLDTGSMLYIGKTSEKTPWKLVSEPVLLSRPLFGWENIQGTINNEGPFPLMTDDKIYIAYSGGSAGGYTYAVGMLSIGTGKDYLNPSEWEKTPTPVLSYYSIEGEYGPGHCSFFCDDDDNIMIAYHAETNDKRSTRDTAVRRVHFGKNGTPILSMSPKRDLNSDLTLITVDVTVN